MCLAACFSQSAWDSLYLGIGKMKAVVEFEVFPPPLELQRRTKKHAATGRENPSSPSNCEIGHQVSILGIAPAESVLLLILLSSHRVSQIVVTTPSLLCLSR